MWWWIAYFVAFIVGTLIAAAMYLHTPSEWWQIFIAYRLGQRAIFPPREYSLLPRKLKNWWGRRKGFGGCGRCGDSWWWKPSHVTHYHRAIERHPLEPELPAENHGDAGCFPLCEECWVRLGTPKDRLPYYVALIDWWAQDSPVPLEQQRAIFSAVAEGK